MNTAGSAAVKVCMPPSISRVAMNLLSSETSTLEAAQNIRGGGGVSGGGKKKKKKEEKKHVGKKTQVFR